MNAFRDEVHRIIHGAGIVRPQIPATAPTGQPTLRRGMKGPAVQDLQARLGLALTDGIFGALTEVAARDFQRRHGIVPDGIVGPKTWALLLAVPAQV
jgi:peptidoglycan hydrolase-like protein with peptidoglycan-binding domain